LRAHKGSAVTILGILSSEQSAVCSTYLERKDYAEAACSCSEAARQGDADAQDYLGQDGHDGVELLDLEKKKRRSSEWERR